MAVLLVAMSIMAVMLTVAMPVWKQASQREKEEELVFRGKQYAHAIGLFQRKYANAYPPNFDVLVTEKFLRKKFKDPVTNDDFAPILVGQQGAGGQTNQNAGRSGAAPTQSGPPGATPQIGTGPGVGVGPGGPGGGTTGGGIMGVTSKSKDKSIRLYNGRSHYNEWQFVYVPQVQNPGVATPGGAPGGQRGNGQNPFPGGAGPIGGQRGRGGPAGPGGGRGPGPGGQPNGPGRGGFGSPFQPNTPQQPIGAPRGGRG